MEELVELLNDIKGGIDYRNVKELVTGGYFVKFVYLDYEEIIKYKRKHVRFVFEYMM